MNKQIGESDSQTTDSDSESSIPTWRQKQRQVREEAILDIARGMIAENGYDAMTMDELAERVGISKPTLYQHFASKEALAVRAVVVQMERSLRFMRETSQEPIAWERLKQIIRQLFSQRFSTGGKHILHGASKVGLTPIVRTHPEYQAVRTEMVATLTEVVEAAKIEGAIETILATRVLIQMIFSLLRDTEYDDLIGTGNCSEGDVNHSLVTVFLNGICKTNP